MSKSCSSATLQKYKKVRNQPLEYTKFQYFQLVSSQILPAMAMKHIRTESEDTIDIHRNLMHTFTIDAI
jgi:hypothetical protein